MSLLDRVKPEYKAIFEHGILTDETRLGTLEFKTLWKMVNVCDDVYTLAGIYGMFTNGIIDQTIYHAVDYSDNETSQMVSAEVEYEIGTEVYSVSMESLAVLRDNPLDDSELEFSHLCAIEYTIYNQDGQEIPIFNLDITEDQIEGILKQLCC